MNVSYSKYLKYKKDVEKSYAEKMSNVRKGSFLFSYFGNILSIFFAYFFFISLFSTTLFNVNPYVAGGIVILFLSLFEYIKRYVFDVFSIQVINTKNVFKKSNLSFFFMTLLLIGFSFFFSLSGAKKLVNKQSVIYKKNTNIIKTKTDSIETYYMINYIEPAINTKKTLIEQKNKLLEQQNIYVERKWNIRSLVKQIKDVDNQLLEYQNTIDKYNKEKNNKIGKIEKTENNLLLTDNEKNKINIIYFVGFSLLIELIIMFGIFYNRKYEFIVKKEYEKKIMNTAKFKKWNLSNIILDMLYDTEVRVNESIPSTNSLFELIQSNDLNINKKELTDIIKILSSLKIIETRGSRRYLKTDITEAKNYLNKYFKIK